MSGKPSAAGLEAVRLYREGIRQLRRGKLRITKDLRRATLNISARSAGVHRSTLWRALNMGRRAAKLIATGSRARGGVAVRLGGPSRQDARRPAIKNGR